ncbi:MULTISPECIES: hypothetical protein [Ruminococcus]|uniref:Uncharacterized protein n=1 Tax=Ruminococcus flavefaciens TaxID=1265 RepID=A0A1M7J211_RUMFL|nr:MULTISPECIES: hypothetical protein [Ruminococcus]MCR4795994.1 hypothetical protein [Ruminococcus sp.]SHM47110.1 hypothetical protein SAMN04487860_10591 [Ruminococcus flavefaciens]
MKDYIQVSESVFRKAEERMAEKKRHSMKVKRNTLAATSAAAVLFVVLMQNESISNAIKSFPKFVSNVWSGEETTTTQLTTQTTVTTTAEVTTTETTEASTTDTEATSTTTTTTTTTEPVTTEQPVTETVSPIADLPRVYTGTWADVVSVSANDDMLVLDNGLRIGLAYSEKDLRGEFKAGDSIKYEGTFAYDKKKNIYYFIKGWLEIDPWSLAPPKLEPDSDAEEYTEPDYDDYTDPYYDDYTEPEDLEEYNTVEDEYRFVYIEDGAPAMDYSDILDSPDFKFVNRQFYKIKGNNIRIKAVEYPYITTEDGQKWFFIANADGLTEDEKRELKAGDIISFIGYFDYLDYEDVLSSLESHITKEKAIADNVVEADYKGQKLIH